MSLEKIATESSKMSRWLWPKREHLHCWSRILLGFVANVGLGMYVLPRLDHLTDIQDYRWGPVDLSWVWLVNLGPSVAVIVLVPVLLSKSVVQRWLAILLSLFPGFLAFFELLQLIMVALR